MKLIFFILLATPMLLMLVLLWSTETDEPDYLIKISLACLVFIGLAAPVLGIISELSNLIL